MAYLIRQLTTWLPYPSTDLTSQVYIVTGSNTGLGFEAAKHLVRLNAARVVLAVRNIEAGEKAAQDIEAVTGRKDVCSVWKLDMTSYASVKAFAARMDGDLDRIDGVLLNAGVAGSPKGREMAEKDELVLTVNVVSTTLLACLSIPTLRKSARKYHIEPRLSVVSSGVHGWSKFPEQDSSNIFEALNDPANTDRMERYCVSKLLEIFAVRVLAEMIDERKKEPKIIFNTLAPGFCKSDLTRHITGFVAVIVQVRKMLFARTTEQGSRTLVHAVLGGEDTHGKYLADCNASEESLSEFVKSEKGHEVEQKFWKELESKLNTIEPGVVSSI